DKSEVRRQEAEVRSQNQTCGPESRAPSPSPERMALKITQQQIDAIRQHGARDYPSECCGILLGHAEGDRKEVTEVVPLENLRRDPERAQALLPLEAPGSESERNRFLIDPRDQIRVEKDARARSLDVLGYYNSHPEHP